MAAAAAAAVRNAAAAVAAGQREEFMARNAALASVLSSVADDTSTDDDNDSEFAGEGSGDDGHERTHGGRRAGQGRRRGSTSAKRHARLVDRMPSRARKLALPEPYRVLVEVGGESRPWWSKAKPWWQEPTQATAQIFASIQEQTVTSFGQLEKAHPINAFEQVIECQHCGCWRSPFTPAAKCCQNGSLVLNRKYTLGDDLLSLARRGVSKVSRGSRSRAGRSVRGAWTYVVLVTVMWTWTPRPDRAGCSLAGRTPRRAYIHTVVHICRGIVAFRVNDLSHGPPRTLGLRGVG